MLKLCPDSRPESASPMTSQLSDEQSCHDAGCDKPLWSHLSCAGLGSSTGRICMLSSSVAGVASLLAGRRLVCVACHLNGVWWVSAGKRVLDRSVGEFDLHFDCMQLRKHFAACVSEY